MEKKQKSELSEEDLDNVTGGNSSQSIISDWEDGGTTEDKVFM